MGDQMPKDYYEYIKAISEGSYFYLWQANMACAIMDAMLKKKKIFMHLLMSRQGGSWIF